MNTHAGQDARRRVAIDQLAQEVAERPRIITIDLGHYEATLLARALQRGQDRITITPDLDLASLLGQPGTVTVTFRLDD